MKLLQRLTIALWLASASLPLGSALLPSTAAAQGGASDGQGAQAAGKEGEDAAESRSAAFQAVEGEQKEQVPGGPLVVGAYGFILVLLVVYVARLGSLNAKNRVELDRLTQLLERGRKG